MEKIINELTMKAQGIFEQMNGCSSMVKINKYMADYKRIQLCIGKLKEVGSSEERNTSTWTAEKSQNESEENTSSKKKE